MSTPKGTGPKPNGQINFSRTTRPAFNGVVKGKTRDSLMVKQDKPKPAPRPAPQLAKGPDRAAFNTRWEKERQAARAGVVPAKKVAPSPDREARKAAFKAKRQAQEQQTRARQKTQSRNR